MGENGVALGERKDKMPYHGFRRHLDGWAKRSEITVLVWESDGK